MKTMNACQIFEENVFLELKDNLGDDEISLFVEENQKVHNHKRD